MRKLQTKDVFNALRAIKKAGLEEEIKPVLKLAGSGELQVEDVGIEGVLTIIEILTEKKSEQVIYEILAGPFEMEAKDVESMDLDNLIEKLKQLAEENNLKSFFTALAGMIGKK